MGDAIARTAAWLRRLPPIAPAIILAGLSAALCTANAFTLRSHGMFSQFDLLFDADPNMRLGLLAHGWPTYETIGTWLFNGVHPLLHYMAAPPLRLFGMAAQVLGADAVRAREAAALLLAPAAVGIGVWALASAMLRLGGQAADATLLAAVAASAGSTQVFGAMPDHFALSGAVLALGVRALAGSRSGAGRWVLLAATACAITITTIVPVIWLWAVHALGPRMRIDRAVIACWALIAGASITIVGSVLALGQAVDTWRGLVSPLKGWESKYRRDVTWHRARELLCALGDSLAPPAVRVVENPTEKQSIHWAFSLAVDAAAPFATHFATHLGGYLMSVGVLAGCALLLRRGGRHRAIALGLIGVLRST